MSEYNVAFVTPKFPPDRGGAATYYDLLVAEMRDRESPNEITVITLISSTRSFVEKNEWGTVCRILPQTDAESSIVRSLQFVVQQFVLIAFLLYLCLKDDRLVLQIHSTMTYVGRFRYNPILDRFFRFLRAIAGARLVLDVRDQHTIPSGSDGYDAIICASQNIYDRIVSETNVSTKSLALLPVPVNIEKIRRHDVDSELSEALPEKYICFVGDISSEKGVPHLIDATNEPTGTKAVVLVGSPVDSQGKQLVNSLPEHVIHLGSLPHEQALQVIDRADWLLLPSRSEGFPRVVLEALALETPVTVTSTIPELRGVENVRFLDSRDPESIRESLEELRELNGMKYSLENHDVSVICSELISLHQSVLKE